MGHLAAVLKREEILHICEGIELSLGQGELLGILANALETEDAATARAIRAISHSIVRESAELLQFVDHLATTLPLVSEPPSPQAASPPATKVVTANG